MVSASPPSGSMSRFFFLHRQIKTNARRMIAVPATPLTTLPTITGVEGAEELEAELWSPEEVVLDGDAPDMAAVPPAMIAPFEVDALEDVDEKCVELEDVENEEDEEVELDCKLVLAPEDVRYVREDVMDDDEVELEKVEDSVADRLGLWESEITVASVSRCRVGICTASTTYMRLS